MVTFNELKIYGRKFYPAIVMEQLMKHRSRVIFRNLIFYAMFAIFVVMAISPHISILEEYVYQLRGVFVILLSLWMWGYMYEGFYLHHYFRKGKIDYEVARLIYNSDEDDLTESFMYSTIGEYVMDRLGITDVEVKLFIKDASREKLGSSGLSFYTSTSPDRNDEEKVVNLIDYVHTIYSNDVYLRKFLSNNRVEKSDLLGTLEWVQSNLWKVRNSERFWSREVLMKVPVVGREWYVRRNDYLDKYAHLIYQNRGYISLNRESFIYEDEAYELQDLLLDQENTNIILKAENVNIGMNTVFAFAKKIAEGKVLPNFSKLKIYVLNHQVLLGKIDDTKDLEEILLGLVEQAYNTRNIAIVIPDLSVLIEQCLSKGIDIVSVLDRIISTEYIPLICITSHTQYYSVVEPNLSLMKHFDIQEVNVNDKKHVMRILQDEVYVIERDAKIQVKYQILRDLVDKYGGVKNGSKKALVELHKKYG